MVDGQPVTAGTVTNAALTYTQTSELARHWRLTRTYVTDPERDAILVKVRFDSLDNTDHDVELAFDPALYGDGDDDVGWTHGHALLAHDRHIASAFEARPALTRTSSGYKGHDDALLEHTYDALRPGNVVQQAHTRLTGRADHQDLTLALAFGGVASQALKTASAAPRRRLRPDGRRLRAGVARLPQHALSDPRLRAAGRRRVRDLALSPQGGRGQGPSRAVHRQPGQPLGPRRLPPRAAAGLLRDRHRAARRGRQGRGQPRARPPARRRRQEPADRRARLPARTQAPGTSRRSPARSPTRAVRPTCSRRRSPRSSAAAS